MYNIVMNIYFSGIGGVGLGPLAEISHDAGYQVFGSDANESLVTKELTSKGIEINYNQDGLFLNRVHAKDKLDWFIYTAALPADHPELLAAKKLGIKTAKRDELLSFIIEEKNLKLIAAAGTHGKTTTSGMFVWVMQKLNIPISYSVGTTLSFGPSGKYTEGSDFFVYECDEFDKNLLHFYPEISVFTSVDFDHPDTYSSQEDYDRTFSQFLSQSRKNYIWKEDIGHFSVLKDSTILSSENQNIKLAGKHNRRNATLVFEALQNEFPEIPENEIIAAINSFPGTNRRFEKISENIYSDYGHHPIEIKATLQMAREISEKVALVYQPHQNIRQHEIIEDYTDDVFKDADKIFWLPTYLTRENPELEILTPETLARNINPQKIHFEDLSEELAINIKSLKNSGYLVLLMGAGTIDSWARNQNF